MMDQLIGERASSRDDSMRQKHAGHGPKIRIVRLHHHLAPARAPGPSATHHQARLVEIVFCIESALQILRHPDILDPKVRAIAGTNAREGVGVVEAPRGILIHHYKVDDNGLVTWANLIVATGHNNLAINRGITQAAKYFVKGDRLTEGALNRVEAVVRCYDPCLSCSTHAVGQMAMRVELRDRNGNLLDERQRD